MVNATELDSIMLAPLTANSPLRYWAVLVRYVLFNNTATGSAKLPGIA